MALRSGIDKLKFDKRMIDINVKKRTLTKSDIDKQLKDLPDLSEKALNLNFSHDLGKSHLN